MNTKLTLSIDTKVIASAKKYSKKRGSSLSKIIEEYLLRITRPDRNSKNSRVPELRGLLGTLPENFDYDQERLMYLKEKHNL